MYTQRRAEYEDVRGRGDVEVRTALLRLAATNEQVSVANAKLALARATGDTEQGISNLLQSSHP